MLRRATQYVQELQAIVERIPRDQHQVTPLALTEGQGLGFITAGGDPLSARRFQRLAHKHQCPQETVSNQRGRVRMGNPVHHPSPCHPCHRACRRLYPLILRSPTARPRRWHVQRRGGSPCPVMPLVGGHCLQRGAPAERRRPGSASAGGRHAPPDVVALREPLEGDT
jgi:hypothetical protein